MNPPCHVTGGGLATQHDFMSHHTRVMNPHVKSHCPLTDDRCSAWFFSPNFFVSALRYPDCCHSMWHVVTIHGGLHRMSQTVTSHFSTCFHPVPYQAEFLICCTVLPYFGCCHRMWHIVTIHGGLHRMSQTVTSPLLCLFFLPSAITALCINDVNHVDFDQLVTFMELVTYSSLMDQDLFRAS